MTQSEQAIRKNKVSAAFKELVLYLFKRQTSSFFIIFGRRGTGKTDFALLVAEILYDEGLIQHIATNTKAKSPDIPITQITNLDDLRFWAQDNRGAKLFIWDEIAKSLNRRKPMASLTIKIIEDIQTLRKHKLSIFGTTIDQQFVDRAVLGPELIDGIFQKPEFNNPKFAVYDDYLVYLHKVITEIPRTRFDFDTWDSPPFTEHGKEQKPVFKEKDMQIAFEWSHGKTAAELGLHNQQLNRVIKKILKELLERQCNMSHPIVRADTDSKDPVSM
jgi:hypothetical protein